MLAAISSAIAANRFGLGARPGELGRIGGDGRDWLRAQLEGAPPAIAAPDLQARRACSLSARAAPQDPAREPRASEPALAVAAKKLGAVPAPHLCRRGDRALSAGRHHRPPVRRAPDAVLEQPFRGFGRQAATSAGLAGSYEREAIRPYVLGNFGDMLLAVETHPAMLLYLDNHLSVGPDSPARARASAAQAERRMGINENLAPRDPGAAHPGRRRRLHPGRRHRLRQGDHRLVDRRARGRFPGGASPGSSCSVPNIHEPGTQMHARQALPESGLRPGRVGAAATWRAIPATAQHIATKLARHFIADDPPPAAVERASRGRSQQRRRSAAGVSRADRQRARRGRSRSAKYKTPNDYIVSAYRGLDAAGRWRARRACAASSSRTAHLAAGVPGRLARPSADWDGASALMKRLEWADAIGQRSAPARRRGAGPQMLGANLSDATRRRCGARPERRTGGHAAARRPRIHAPLSTERGDEHDQSCRDANSSKLGALAAGGALLDHAAVPSPRSGARCAPRVGDHARRARRPGGGAALRRSGLRRACAASSRCARPGQPMARCAWMVCSACIRRSPSSGESYAARELVVFQALATPYRERSHFDGQDVLESGMLVPHASQTGWLNRALASVPADRARRRARRGAGLRMCR